MVKSALHQQPPPMVKWPTRATPDALKFSRLVAAVSHLQMSNIEKEGFLDIASRYLSGKAKPLEWSKVQMPIDVVPYDNLVPAPEDPAVKSLLDKLAVLKLNGGLVTFRNCTCPMDAS